MHFKTLRGKRTTSARSGLELLQMVSESDISQCVSEDAGPRREVEGEIPHQLERETSTSETVGPEREGGL